MFFKGNGNFYSDVRGYRWCDGSIMFTGFNTVLPPNAPCCVDGSQTNAFNTDNVYEGYGWGLFPPSSEHPGGVNVLFADGSTRFITDTVYCGNLNNAEQGLSSRSNYGFWGSLGSRNASDTLTREKDLQ
jgi:prepilin-type processing-associated H-X9-DG protein